MGSSNFSSPVDFAGLLKAVSLIAVAAGVGVGATVLWAPSAGALPPALSMASPARTDIAAVAQWFGGAALRVRVTAAGVIAADDGRGAALLSVDGAPAQAFQIGQSLAPGVVLHAVSPTAVAIDQDGVIETVAMPISAASRVQGFIPVPPSAPGVMSVSLPGGVRAKTLP